MSKFRFLSRLLAAGCLMACAASVAFAAGDGARFCVVPVKDSAPTEADVGATSRITSNRFLIPGLPGPVFTPTNRQGVWTIDASGRLVPYDGPFPTSYLDWGNWVVEPWSSRVVAAGRKGVSVIAPGTARFDPIDSSRVYGNVAAIPRLRLTIVGAGDAGLIVGDRSVTPWRTSDELTAHGIRGIRGVYDAPLLSAIIVRDVDRRLHAVTDDGRWHLLARLSKDDSVVAVYDAPASSATLVVALKTVLAVRRSTMGAHSTEILAESSSSVPGNTFHRSRLFGQVLAYGDGGFFDQRKRWRRLETNGFADIPGGDIDLPEGGVPNGRIHDLTTIGRVLIEGRDGFYLYDGQRLTAIKESGRERLGKFLQVYDLPSIGRVIVATAQGLLEITSDARLVPHSMPFSYAHLLDWPESKVALASTGSGLFTFGADLVAVPVAADTVVGISNFLAPFVGISPGSGDAVVSAAKGIYLVVDRERRGPDACALVTDGAGDRMPGTR